MAWVGALIAVLAATWLLVVWLDKAGVTSTLRERGGVWGAIALVLVHAAVAISPAPGEPVALANSAMYGFGWGAAMNWAGWMLAAVVEFALLQRAVKTLTPEQSAKRLPYWLRRLPADHPAFLIAGRWIPFGGHVVNFAAAAKATFWRHVWCAALGLVPVALFFSALANGWRFFW